MKDKRQLLEKVGAIIFALLVWHIVSIVLGEEMLLVSPVTVLRRLSELCQELTFWNSIWFSCIRILSGCALAFVTGVALAILASCFRAVDILTWPFLAAIKATPVASFIILCLIWFRAENLSVVMAFLMVLPMIYSNILEGIRQADSQLLEMAHIFHIKKKRQILYIYIPSVIPYLLSASKVAVGLSWKAGIAAEVIGIPDGSIGEMLYQAKIYLNSADLFAWTVAIVAISMLVEKCVLVLCRMGVRRLEKL